MIIVTAGFLFADIDAYGGCIAYAELLNKLGQEARAVITSPLNDSITPKILDWRAPLETTYQPNDTDEFCIIDISEPAFLERFVEPKRVVKVIDHHTGFEDEWAHLGKNATLDFIGAACTLVYEEWIKAGKLDEMSELSARLLICGILDNTLNFKASLTTDRDHTAYETLLKVANLPAEWPAEYFNDCQQSVEHDLPTALKNDMKLIRDLAAIPEVFAQLTLWDAKDFLARHEAEISQNLSAIGEEWMLNLISMEDGHSYIFATDQAVQTKLAALMNIEFHDNVATTDRLYLRKEILKKAQE